MNGLIYITGISGVGKSTLRDELVRRGYEAHDIDAEGMTAWYDKLTGAPAEKPQWAEARTEEWYAAHEWKVSVGRVEEMARSAEEKLIFLCGTTANDDEIWALFSHVISLTIDEDILKKRLATRTSHDFGKAPAELKNILSWHKYSEEANCGFGAIMIDASPPSDVVADEILKVLVAPRRKAV